SEETLRASEQRYARALEATEEGLWEWNPTTDEAFVSPRARRLFGVPDGVEIRSRADLLRHDGFHPQDRERVDGAIREQLSLSSGGFETEYRVIDPGGGLRWLSSRGKVFSRAPGQDPLVTGSISDITARRRAEQALHESEERFRHMADTIPEV